MTDTRTAHRERQVRFGPFLFDRETGELWRMGEAVRFRRQPARLLALLLSRPNQLVSHDDIIAHLWGDRIVEYDQGVHACIRQIRTALDDDASQPQWIETVPKSGYRFVGPVRSPGMGVGGVGRLIRAATLAAAGAAVLWTGGASNTRVTASHIVMEIDSSQRTLATTVIHELRLLSGIVTPDVDVQPDAPRPRMFAVTARGDTVDVLDLTGSDATYGREIARRTVAALVHGAVPIDAPPRRARDAFLRGQYLLESHDDARLETALDLFHQVIEAVPEFAPAFAAVARIHLIRGEYPPAGRAAERALAIDSGSARAHLVMANLALYGAWDRVRSATHHRAALRKYPGWSMAHVSYAFLLSAEGRHEEALAHARLALELDPVSPIVHGDLGLLYMLAGDFKHAAAHCRRTLELDPTQWFPRGCLVDALLAAGDSLGAKREAASLMASFSANAETIRQVRDATTHASLASYWRWTLTWTAPRANRWYPYLAARAYVGLHEYGSAVATLARALDEHATTVVVQEDGGRQVIGTAMLPALGVDPRFAPLHGDVRFTDLLDRLAGVPREPNRPARSSG